MTKPRTGGRTGRRPGHQPTRREICDAARQLFAADGYRATTIRAIAAAANVDPALIHRHFGSKENLFAATLDFPAQAAPNVLAALHSTPAGLGERLTRAYLRLWEDPSTREQMEILTKSSLTSTETMARVRPAIARVVGQIRTTDLPGPHPEIGFQLAMGQLLGVACVRHLTQAPPLSTLPFEDLVARVAPAVQLHLISG
jgi:AcrR family transcriptional regulator